MKTAEEMKKEFSVLYTMMAESENVDFMHVFGMVHKEMMEWFIQNKPELAQEWLDKLESIKWKNYLTQKEAESIVKKMEPEAPWTEEQWKQVMEKNDINLEKEPCYNRHALWATMCMIMSDSSETITKYVEDDDLFGFVYELAVDKLTDKDGVFSVRHYWNL